MSARTPKTELRTVEKLREHYEIEKELARTLRNASKEERRLLYTALYDELYRRVPHHPQLTRKASETAQQETVSRQLKLLQRFLQPTSTFMEIGPGDCSLSLAVARLTRKVYALDVSAEITKRRDLPTNFQLILSDGCSVPVPRCSVHVAYSDQLMEHLHPDDAQEQLRNIYQALAPGGVYICITPNRLNGPHDVSQYFDDIATGFHLKEYTTSELISAFTQTGFSKFWVAVGVKGRFAFLPTLSVRWIESALARCPRLLRKTIASRFPLRSLLGVLLIAQKP